MVWNYFLVSSMLVNVHLSLRDGDALPFLLLLKKLSFNALWDIDKEVGVRENVQRALDKTVHLYTFFTCHLAVSNINPWFC